MGSGSLETALKIAATDSKGNPIFTSEGGQDQWLWEKHFKFINRTVTYIDIGSNDPVFTSNTFFLDRCLNARGICVEANPRFKDRYSFRNCAYYQTCLSDSPTTVEFAFQSKDFSTRSGILKSNKSYKRKKGSDHVFSTATMNCTTGAALFKQERISHADWLDLDAEGHELSILQGIDWSTIEIDIITVEENGMRLKAYLQSLGYRLNTNPSKLHYDLLFLRSGFDLYATKNPNSLASDLC
jgi:FkbM family methyltransferase